MKLRIQGDSIRLRLSRSEVAELAERGRVEDKIRFGAGAALRYELATAEDARSVRAAFAGGAIRIVVPAQSAREWLSKDVAGITSEQPLDEQARLSIVIEKDFQCIHKPDGRDDAFPNPLAAAK